MKRIQIPNDPEHKKLIEFLKGLDKMGTIVLPDGERLVVNPTPAEPVAAIGNPYIEYGVRKVKNVIVQCYVRQHAGLRFAHATPRHETQHGAQIPRLLHEQRVGN